MSQSTDQDDPLERLYERTTEDGDPVTLTAVELDEAEFRDRLAAIATAADPIEDLATDAAALRRSGLRDSDVRDLIYGRNAGLRKGDIESILDALDGLADASQKRRSKLLVRLLADVTGGTIAETEEILDELRALHERYPPEDSA